MQGILKGTVTESKYGGEISKNGQAICLHATIEPAQNALWDTRY